jgi:membrane protease YdiL (CAAX protease family)
MKHLESAFKGKNSFWRYLVMFGVVLLAINTIGSIPLFIAYVAKVSTNPEIISEIGANPSNIISFLGYDLNIGLFIMLFPYMIGLITFFLLVKPINNRTFKQTINGTSSIRWNRFFVSAFIWILISAAYLFIYKGIDPLNFTLNNTSFTLIILIGISVLFIPLQTAFEEILFRGYLMQGFAVLLRNRWFPLIMTSLLFGLMHGWNPEVKEFGFFTMMPQYILYGLLFGITTILDDGIEIALGAHAAQNVFVSIMITNSSSVLQTPALYEQKNIYPWIEFGALVVSALLFFIIMKMIYKWDDISILWQKVRKEEEIVQTL